MMPKFTIIKHFNSHAHVERDADYRLWRWCDVYFNSHAHVERDICTQIQPINVLDFNSHAHVERDIYNRLIEHTFYISTHTLTWSVTHLWQGFPASYLNFNSHAHVERDCRCD